MSIISIVLPIVILGAIWFFLIRGGKALRGGRKESAFDYAKTHSIDEVLAKYGTVAQPTNKPREFERAPARAPVPLTSTRVLGPELHENGRPEENPFGEDLVSPDSRVIPAAFHGSWAYRSKAGSITSKDVIIEADQFTRSQAVGMQPVVAVRIISDTEIAVVSQSIENGRWLYSLNYFGLIDDGNVLADLESMDMRWERER